MKKGISFIALVLFGFSFQASAGNVGIQRIYSCTASMGFVREATLNYIASIYSMPGISLVIKNQIPFKAARYEANTVLGLDLNEIYNHKQYADSGSSIEVSAAADEMERNSTNIVVRVRIYNSGILQESATTMGCKFIEQKDLN